MDYTEEHKSYAIMQPYFLPYIGYFSLIKETDRWIVFDDIQYQKQSWGNRNRILKHPNDWTWIRIPIIKNKRYSNYSDMKIQNSDLEWKSKLIRQFEYYRQYAPHYNDVINLLNEILEPEFEYLVDLNIYAIKKICKYLDINFDYIKYSELNLDIDYVKDSGDWALQICKKMKLKSYVNPYFGYFMFNQEDWDNANINLKFLMNKNIPYNQHREKFEDKMSIIDVLMWNSKEETQHLLQSKYHTKDSLSKLSLG